MSTVYVPTKKRKSMNPSLSGHNSVFVPVADRVHESWIDIINKYRITFRLNSAQIARLSGLGHQFIRDVTNKKRFCSYSNYWKIHRVLAVLVAQIPRRLFE